jgi:hypothetical protein
MTISLKCPSCQKTLEAPDTAAGKTARCPSCSQIVSIPGDKIALEAKEEKPMMTGGPQPSRNVAQNFCYISVAIMCLCISGLAVVGIFYAKKSGDAIAGYCDALAAAQNELNQQSKDAEEIVTEALVYFAVRGLQEAEALSPVDADGMAKESIMKVSAKSQRLGKIATALDDLFQKQQRNKKSRMPAPYAAP